MYVAKSSKRWRASSDLSAEVGEEIAKLGMANSPWGDGVAGATPPHRKTYVVTIRTRRSTPSSPITATISGSGFGSRALRNAEERQAASSSCDDISLAFFDGTFSSKRMPFGEGFSHAESRAIFSPISFSRALRCAELSGFIR